MSLVTFATVFGPAYCRQEDILYVSSPFTKRGNPAARAIGLSSGHTLYALDNDYNRERLNQLGLLPPVEEIKEAMKHCGREEPKPAEPKPTARKSRSRGTPASTSS